jgi:hypothetical protein
MQQTQQSNCFRIGQWAEATNMSVAFWRKQFRAGRGPKVTRLGKIILVAKSDAQEFLDAQVQGMR